MKTQKSERWKTDRRECFLSPDSLVEEWGRELNNHSTFNLWGQQRCVCVKDFEFMGLVMPTRRTTTETRGDVLGEIASDSDIWT